MMANSTVARGKNCAFYDTSMKLGSLVDFEVSKKIRVGTPVPKCL